MMILVTNNNHNQYHCSLVKAQQNVGKMHFDDIVFQTAKNENVNTSSDVKHIPIANFMYDDINSKYLVNVNAFQMYALNYVSVKTNA